MAGPMRSPLLSFRRLRQRPFCFFIAGLFGACTANGDFGRVRPALRSDTMHDWVGRDAVGVLGQPPSVYPLTDDEQLLRDLAYPLIQPPYDRQRWYSVLGEYGFLHAPPEFPQFDGLDYWVNLGIYYRRSEASAYAQIGTDARNDFVRIEPFFAVAVRVADMDQKRASSLAFVSDLSPPERDHAIFRNNENAAVMAWVCRSLNDRAGAYRYALERLVISVPSTAAVETGRTLTQLVSRIDIACRAYGGRPLVTKG